MSPKFLLLGSGFVTPGFVDFILTKRPESTITIASNVLPEAEKLKSNSVDPSRCSVVTLDVFDADKLGKLVSEHDLAISLVPAPFHPEVAKQCIKFKKNMVTASYVSPAMAELDEAAKAAGVTILNEIGLDPGLDHISAVKVIKEAHDRGQKVLEFESWCGGLPAPQDCDNPLGYKFSWNPRGVLTAACNDAYFYRDGQEVVTKGTELLTTQKRIDVTPGFRFEGIPNRDSRKYREAYHIPEAQTCIRGTLRYEGYCDIVHSFKVIGLLSQETNPLLAEDAQPISWKRLLESLIGVEPLAVPQLEKQLAAVWEKKGCNFSPEVVKRNLQGYHWFNMFDDKVMVERRKTPLDSLCAILEKRLQFEDDEKDMVAMQHTFKLQNPDGSMQLAKSRLILYGDDKLTAMARTVGLPLAVAALTVLDGEYTVRGVMAPLAEDFAPKLLANIEEQTGIRFKESIVAL
eukprot:GCRY01001270.1.p1 GENE.GCRY01001270.1~~GCRY01001270.1.p1  ORF type:complete len:460 (+),score=92.85 GCRY01001270.1:87-1466(+)